MKKLWMMEEGLPGPDGALEEQQILFSIVLIGIRAKIFLITDKPFLLFPTIHSRVTKIFMDPPNEKEISEYFLKKSLKLDKDFIQNINEYIDISNLSQEKNKRD